MNNPTKQTIICNFANDGAIKVVNTLLAIISRLGGHDSSRRILHNVDGDGSY